MIGRGNTDGVVVFLEQLLDDMTRQRLSNCGSRASSFGGNAGFARLHFLAAEASSV
jgi:hypothetical protein